MPKQKKSETFRYIAVLAFVLFPVLFILVQKLFNRSPVTPDSSPDQNVISMPESSPPTVNGVPLTIAGTIVCLPQKDKQEIENKNCSYGLKDNTGAYYGLRDHDADMKNLSMIQMNENVQLAGLFKKEENSFYPTVGIFEIQSVNPQ